MRFLITNDDGYDAAGLELLARIAANFGEVHIVAPANQQSGISHRITFERPIQLKQLDQHLFSLVGTPADCVRVAISHLGGEYDWVLAGVNDGANLGVDVYYSGTVAAAREATFFRVPAIAVSQYRKNYSDPYDFAATESLLNRLLDRFVSDSTASNRLINVNFPDRAATVSADSIEIVECDVDSNPLPPEYRETADGLVTTSSYFHRPRSSDHDIDVCFNGNVSVSYL